jgi:RHS repeat-associated protein
LLRKGRFGCIRRASVVVCKLTADLARGFSGDSRTLSHSVLSALPLADSHKERPHETRSRLRLHSQAKDSAIRFCSVRISVSFAPQWIQLDLGSAHNLSKIRLAVAQYPDGQTTHEVYGGPSADNLTLLGSLSGWTSNGQWLELTTSAANVRYVKVLTTSSPSWVAWGEIEVYETAASAPIHWLVTDQLGTPRMVFDQKGSLAGVSRHDYLPFGEELYAGTGGRGQGQGYAASDGVRQHFTGYEADTETGLNFAQARYQSPVQGRFTSVDPLGRSANVLNPQSLNRYSYVENDPLNAVDPTGMMLSDIGIVQTQDEQFARTLQGASDAAFMREINLGYAMRHDQSISYGKNGQAQLLSNSGSQNYWNVGEVPFYGYQDDNNQIFWLPPAGIGPYSLPAEEAGTSADTPKDLPSSSGYLDIGGGYSWPIWGPLGAGFVGGIQSDGRRHNPYLGGQLAIPPGKNYSAMYSPDSISPGLTIELSGTSPWGGASVGTDFSGDTFTSFGTGSLGGQLSLYYVVDDSPTPRKSLNCACNVSPPNKPKRHRHQ